MKGFPILRNNELLFQRSEVLLCERGAIPWPAPRPVPQFEQVLVTMDQFGLQLPLIFLFLCAYTVRAQMSPPTEDILVAILKPQRLTKMQLLEVARVPMLDREPQLLLSSFDTQSLLSGQVAQASIG